jgi:two-component sensor histidine kinase
VRIDSNAVINECIREVVREAINNAIKHAKSSNIVIELNLSGNTTIDLSVINSADQSTTTFKDAGLGSKMMEELTDLWSIEYKADSTELRATFKVKEPLG